MKKVSIAIIFCLLAWAFAQTEGTANLKFKTVTYNGPYKPSHCLAAWITDNNSVYVKSLEVKAHFPSYGTYLTKWKASSGHNVNTQFTEIDAVTGASLTSHVSHNLNWNLKNKNGVVVPDGTYKVNLEFTESNGTGKYFSFTFDKGAAPVSLTPPNQTYFINMSLTYTPTVSINENEKTADFKFYNYPNPFNNTSTINYTTQKNGNVSLEIYDNKGSLVKTLVKGQVAAGEHSALWEGTNNHGSSVASGTYYYVLKVNNQSTVKKALLLK